MATTKTVNVTNGKFLNYQVSKTGYKPVTGSIYVDGNKTVNVNLVSTSSPDGVYKLGDRILGMASFVCYYTPGGTYDSNPISTATILQTVGSGIQNLGVKKSVFETQISTEGEYLFTFDGTDWNYDNATVTLSTYGIFYNTATSVLSSGDTIKVTYTTYNKYAVFVLDANYRTNAQVSTIGSIYDGNTETPRVPANCPIYSDLSDSTGTSSTVWYYNQLQGQESGTWTNNCILNNQGWDWTTIPGFAHCRQVGTYVLTNGIQITPVLPNISEAWQIVQNRVFLDSIDPIIQGGSSAYNLTSMNFSDGKFFTCQKNSSTESYKQWAVNAGSIVAINGTDSRGIVPVFEVPCK